MSARATRLALAAALALGLGAGIAACGGEEEGEPIPARQARSLQRQLANIERQSDNGACAGAEDKLDALQRAVERLPERIDADVREALADGVERLRELVLEVECPERRDERERERDEREETETEPETETETDTTDTTDETDTTDTTDTEPPPDTTDTEPTEPVDPDFTTPGGNVPPGQDGGTPAPGDE